MGLKLAALCHRQQSHDVVPLRLHVGFNQPDSRDVDLSI